MSTRVTHPTILNVVLPVENTEVAVDLPPNTAQFQVQARTAVAVSLAYALGDSAVVRWTVKSGAVYSETGLTGNVRKLYLQSATAGAVVEIVAWT